MAPVRLSKLKTQVSRQEGSGTSRFNDMLLHHGLSILLILTLHRQILLLFKNLKTSPKVALPISCYDSKTDSPGTNDHETIP